MGGSSLSRRKAIVRPSVKRDILPCIAGHDPQAEGHMASFIGRRRFLATLGGSAVAWPLAVRSQQQLVPVIGWLSSGSRETDDAVRLPDFRKGLSEAGYTEGRNVAIEYRRADEQLDRLPALAADLIGRQVSLILAAGSPAVALAAKSLTTSIPIVFDNSADPVQLGLVASLNRPGRNVTGVATVSGELEAKRLGLLRELVPSATSIAVLVNPSRPGLNAQLAQIQQAARVLGLSPHILKANSERDLDAVFATLVELKAGALVITADALFTERHDQIAALAKRYSVPTMFQFREFATTGGLISYGPSIGESYRLAGMLAGRILKGEKPADLPVMQLTKFELVINMKTAKSLGIEVPISMQLLADEVIE
jgi:putative tryptophan/tyrosine transport system substrate-binding protein